MAVPTSQTAVGIGPVVTTTTVCLPDGEPSSEVRLMIEAGSHDDFGGVDVQVDGWYEFVPAQAPIVVYPGCSGTEGWSCGEDLFLGDR